MFGSIGWGEVLVLVIAGLVILGPERLPGAITWVSTSLRQIRVFAQDASSQLREQIGPEFSDLKEPIEQLSKLRRTSPSAFISQHLLDGQTPKSLLDPFGAQDAQPSPRPQSDPPLKPLSTTAPSSIPAQQAKPQGEAERGQTPFDSDAT